MSDIALLAEVRAFLQQGHDCFINGEYGRATGPAHPVVNPGTGETFSEVREAEPAQTDAAVNAAHHAFHRVWRDMAPLQRGAILNRLADLIDQHGEELAQLETLCSGKTIQLSRAFEVGQSSHFLRYYAGWAGKINGETLTPSLPSMQGERYTAFTLREPVGVVAGIVPWNFSLMIAIWKIASALVCGCTVVIKPSEFTPFTLLRLAGLAKEAGLPDGVLNVVCGTGACGQALIEHEKISKVSFTGSMNTGRKVGAQAMQANLTRATLELGGKNAAGFLADIDPQKAVAGVMEAAYLHQGQVCAAAERFYVHRSRLDEIVDGVAAQLKQLKIGSPLDESTDFGPLSNRPHFEKVSQYFASAPDQGCEIVHGGRTLDRPGFFIEPTLAVADRRDATLLQEEVFGPVACFLPFDDEEELLSLMNDSPYGLTASLWTNDLSRALRLVPRIEAGTVWVNMHTFIDPAVPFGGVKGSGIGREFGSAFIEDYTELKSVTVRY